MPAHQAHPAGRALRGTCVPRPVLADTRTPGRLRVIIPSAKASPLFFFFLLFRAAPMAYGGSQAKGRIRTTAAGLLYSHSHSHSHAGSQPRLRPTPQLTAILDLSCIRDLHHSSQQHQILNPLIEARDRTCNLMVPSWICFCCTRRGTPDSFFPDLYILLPNFSHPLNYLTFYISSSLQPIPSSQWNQSH